MSTRTRRRRESSRQVKVAFGDDDNSDDRDQQADREALESAHSPPLSKAMTNGHGSLDKVYERAFFTVENITVEVVLENEVLHWASVSGTDMTQRMSDQRDDKDSVNLRNVFAITPINAPASWPMTTSDSMIGTTPFTASHINGQPVSAPSSSSSISNIRGFQLHSYQLAPDNVYQEILIIFQNNSPYLIEQWYNLLSNKIFANRTTRHVLVVCHPYAGAKRGRYTYNSKVRPMLEQALYKITYLEVDTHCDADQVLRDFEEDLDSLHGLVIVGGDGTVISVINALIRHLAKENRTRLDMENELPPLPFPLCIVPEGTTNVISHTIQGNTDHYTPIIHLLFNHTMNIDMSAIYDADHNFVTANFSAGAGYPAHVLSYFPRYMLHGPKTIIKKSFSKAASNKNLKPVAMEIRYIPANQNSAMISRCYRGCSSCTPEAIEKNDNRVEAFDDSHLQTISKRNRAPLLNQANSRRVLSGRGSHTEKAWKTLQGEYLQVAILTNACVWSYAPQGLSKFGHLADGLLDLVLVQPTTRKEFLRYVKRNGNSKNQYELPFVSLIKVKEVEIELMLPADDSLYGVATTDNQMDSSPSDYSSNEDTSDNEMRPSATRRHQPHPPPVPISDDSRRNRRRHHRLSEQAPEFPPNVYQSSQSMDTSTLQAKYRSQQSQNESDSLQGDPQDSAMALRRSSIHQSFKGKLDKLNLPRPFSARSRDVDEDKQQRKNRRTAGGTMRPARSLLNLLTGGSFSSGRTEQPSAGLARDSFSASGRRRRPSVISRSSSADHAKPATNDDTAGSMKGACLWNLDFSPYSSPLIRLKCLYRYLPVFGVGLDPGTRIKEVNYSCFGRMS